MHHWDPTLGQLAWARTIGFTLSGAMLAASASSAVQTLRLFARWAPGLALAQVAATYVIAATLLLRSQLPAHAGGAAICGVVRSALGPPFVDTWFEAWFLAGAALTALALCVARSLALADADDGWWDEHAAEDLGAKRQ